MAERVRNWGRWGADDQIGALNFITPDVVRDAARLVTQGRVFPLGIPLDADGVWSGNSIRRNPVHQFVVDGGDSQHLGGELNGWTWARSGEAVLEATWAGRTRFADDTIFMSLQGATQWDALSHIWYDEQLYNGFSAHSVTSRGATKNGIEQTLNAGIVTRGLLLDVPRHRGFAHLPPNEPILVEELDEVCRAQGVTPRRGDILLVRTGWWSTFTRGSDGAAWRAGSPGLHWTTAEWLHRHEVAAVAADNLAVEVAAYDVEDAFLPLHLLCQRDMGVMFGEFWNLDDLAQDCAQDGCYEVQIVAAPLNIPGAVGSPLNPIALK